MTLQEFIAAWPILKRQVRSLHLPWLDQVASADRDPFKVLISCILSLRTQDKVTGEASRRIFELARTPEALSRLSVEKIEKAIYPVGFYRVKARRIKKISREIIEKYNGKVPDTIEELLTLEGVGRKTANLVVTLGYKKDGICVDTHVHRVSNRWGLVQTKTPAQTETALREGLPRRYWLRFNHLLVTFGQTCCKPLSPHCSTCPIAADCPRIGVARHR